MRKVLDKEKLAKEEMAKGPYTYVQLLEAGHSCHRPFLVGYLCTVLYLLSLLINQIPIKRNIKAPWDGMDNDNDEDDNNV